MKEKLLQEVAEMTKDKALIELKDMKERLKTKAFEYDFQQEYKVLFEDLIENELIAEIISSQNDRYFKNDELEGQIEAEIEFRKCINGSCSIFEIARMISNIDESYEYHFFNDETGYFEPLTQSALNYLIDTIIEDMHLNA